MGRLARSWIVALALAGCTGLGAGTMEASDEPTHVEPLPEGAIAEPIAPQSPTTAIQRYRVADLADDHGLTPGRFVGLYAIEGRAAGRVVGVAEVVRADAREAELAALWVDLDRQRVPLTIGEPAPRRFGAVFGHLVQRSGSSAPSHLDIGAVHGALTGDLYAALSDDPTPREVGLLKVVAVDDGARVVWLRGEAPPGARVRRVGHEAATVAPLRVLVPRLAGDRGAAYGAALQAALDRVAVSSELRVEAVDVAVADAAAAVALARERQADAVVWGSAARSGAAVALRLGVAFVDARRTAEQAGFGAPRATRTIADQPEALAHHAQQLAPLVAGWTVHSELLARGGASARAASYFADALASDDPQTVADARVRLFHCRRAMHDWAGASRFADAVERDGETGGGEDRVHLGRLMRARLAATAGALDTAETLARAVATRYAEDRDRRGAADAMLVVADALRQRRDLADAQAILEKTVVPAYASLGARRAEADALALLAAVHGERGTLHEAIAILRDRATPLLEGLDETGALATVASDIAALQFRIGATEEALQSLRAAASTMQRLGDVAGRTTALERIGEIQEERGELDEALQVYAREIVPTRKRLGHLRGVARARERAGQIRAQRSDLDGALPDLQAALAMYTLLADRRGAAEARRWLAFVETSRGEYDRALKILRDVLPVYSREDDRPDRAMTLKEIAFNEHVSGNDRAALDLLQRQVLPGLSGPGDLREHAIARVYLALVLADEERLAEAMTLLSEALRVFERLPAPLAAAQTRYEIGAIHHKRGELDRALRIYREVAPVLQRAGNTTSHGVVMGRIADIHYVRGELGDAMKIRKRIEFAACERAGDERCRALVTLGIAELGADEGKLEQSLALIDNEARPLVDKLGDRSLQALAHLHRADVLYRLGRPGPAMAALRDEVLPRYAGLGNDQGEAVAYSFVAMIEEDQGRPDAALETLLEKVLPIHQRHTDKLNLLRTQVHIAGLLLMRSQADDRAQGTKLLREARTAARALKASDLRDIETMARDFGLDLDRP